LRLIILWTASSYASYFMVFENKYIEGNIFIFYYYEGISGVIASLLAQLLYVLLQTRKAFITSISLVFFGALMILLFETNVIRPDYIVYLTAHRSPHAPGSAEDKEYYLKLIIPIFVMFTKVAVNILFQVTYLASFTDDQIFPFLKRATSIGICNFVARIATIFAPMVAEQAKPLPEVYLLVIVTLAFFVAIFMPLDDYDEAPKEDSIYFTTKQSKDGDDR